MTVEPTSIKAPPLGTTLKGGYKLQRFLGAGGMGAVYEALTPDGRHVAVKVLLELSHTSRAQEVVDRFKREANVTASLESPHVVALLDAGIDDALEIPFLVLPLLSGLDLDGLTERTGPLHPTVAVRIILQSCKALEVAHHSGVIHRDIKPANLFLDHNSKGEVTVRVLDFGIAKWFTDESNLTSTGSVLGTPAYMAPEQTMDAKKVDARADVWSLAVSLYEALSGTVPFDDLESFAELHVAINTRDTPPLQDVAPWVDPGLAMVVHGCMLRDREARCPTVAEFALALEPYSDGGDELVADMLAPIPPEMRDVTAKRAVLPTFWKRMKPSRPPPTIMAGAPDPMLGVILSERYRLLRRLGQGGMGAVYEAQDDTGYRYAVKVIDPELAGKNPGARRRFVREARAVTSIESDHVVRVAEADTDPRQQVPYIVMELLHGVDLDVMLGRHGALEPQVVARLFIQAARGIGAAHALSLVHRDIKPANLFLHQVPSGEVVVKVCDFGIAKRLATDGGEETTANLTRTGGVLGSPMYMSPEQAKNAKQIDHRTDIWSLGIALYQALCGKAPWKGRETVGELILAICTEHVPNLQDQAPWLDPALAEVAHKALDRDLAARFQSMDEFAAALAPFAGKTTEVRPRQLTPVREELKGAVAARSAALDATLSAAGAVAHTVVAAPAPRRGVLTAAVVGVALLGAGAGGYFLLGRPAQPPPAAVAPAAEPTPTAASPSTAAAPAVSAEQPVFEVAVEVVPPTATVTVDGQEAQLTDGKLKLSGSPGKPFKVAVTDGKRTLEEQIIITHDGEPTLGKLDLSKGAVATRPGHAGTSPAVPTGPPATGTAPTTPPATTAPAPATTGLAVEDWDDE